MTLETRRVLDRFSDARGRQYYLSELPPLRETEPGASVFATYYEPGPYERPTGETPVILSIVECLEARTAFRIARSEFRWAKRENPTGFRPF
jgi:hypothetical protein